MKPSAPGAEGHHRRKKQTGGASQFRRGVPAHRTLPGGVASNSSTWSGGSIPGQFMPAVEKGVRRCIYGAIVPAPAAGRPRVIVYDGKHHPVDSKVAFVAAGEGLPRRQPSPRPAAGARTIVDLEVHAPEQHMGDISGGLSANARASAAPIERGGEIVVRAQCRCRNWTATPRAEIGDRRPRPLCLGFQPLRTGSCKLQQKLVELKLAARGRLIRFDDSCRAFASGGTATERPA